MAPKTKFGNPSKGKGIASSSTARRTATHPWPRPEEEPFDIARDGLPPNSTTAWDEIDAFNYNKLLALKLEPTRFLCDQTLTELGLKEQVHSILLHARCMCFALEEDVLYPDLTRQCLATATLTYANPEAPSFEEATFSFFAGGTRYEIPMTDFCNVYGFHTTDTRLESPGRLKESKTFWNVIASGTYSSNSASQNRLRHPALRVVARLLSNMLFDRPVGNKVHNDELMLLFLGVGNIVGDGDLAQFEHYRYNLGIRFAETLCAIKTQPASTASGPRVERIGSLLTSLFRHLRVDFSEASCVDEVSRVDMQHLLNSKIIVKPRAYQFIAANGEPNFIMLPCPLLTQLNTWEDLAFQPPPEYLVPNPSRSSSAARPSTCSRRSTSRPSTCSISQTEEAGPSIPRLTYHTVPQGEFDLPNISDDADGVEYRQWMIESTRRNNRLMKENNSLMQRIMAALSKGCCHATVTRDTQPVPSSSTSGSGQPLERKKRKTRGNGSDDASTR